MDERMTVVPARSVELEVPPGATKSAQISDSPIQSPPLSSLTRNSDSRDATEY